MEALEVLEASQSADPANVTSTENITGGHVLANV